MAGMPHRVKLCRDSVGFGMQTHSLGAPDLDRRPTASSVLAPSVDFCYNCNAFHVSSFNSILPRSHSRTEGPCHDLG